MEGIREMIRPELLILIPVLYFVGVGLKKSVVVKDRFIPLILGTVGVLMSVLYQMATTALTAVPEILMMVFVGITQGVLCAGCSVYCDQLKKQSKKDCDK